MGTASKQKHKKLKVRPNRITSDKNPRWPPTAQLLIRELTDHTSRKGLDFCTLTVPLIPLSWNHQYMKKVFQSKEVWDPKKNKFVRRHRIHQQLREEVRTFRLHLRSQFNESGKIFRATGVTAAVVLFETPEWITMDFTVRVKDVDNLVKPVFDAAQDAVHVADERHWEIHAYKVASKRIRTTIYLFDLGDVVDYYY